MLCGLLWLIPLVLLLRLLSLILLVPLRMRGLLSLVPRLILLLVRLIRGLLSLVPRLILLLLRLMLRLPLLSLLLIRRATFTVALAASAAIAASTPPALAAASDLEISNQSMTSVGSVHAPVELFHADEATLQVTQTEICFQRKIAFLGSIGGGKTLQKSAAHFLLGYLNIVILYVDVCSGNVLFH